MGDKNLNNETSKKAKSFKDFYSKNATILAILAALIVVILISIILGHSLFSDTKDDTTNTKIGEIEVQLVEDWPEQGESFGEGSDSQIYDEFGIKKYTKKVWGHSTGDMDAYVRIRCIPIVEYYVETEQETPEGETVTIGEWITAPVSQDDIIVAVNSINENEEECWIQDGNYWYYKKVLAPGEDTDSISIDWQVASLPEAISKNKIRTNVRVVLEYAQTTHGLWKNIFQIETLPEGVEQVTDANEVEEQTEPQQP